MSALDDILAGGLAVYFQVHGQPVSYFSHAAQTNIVATAIVGAEEIVSYEEPGGALIRRRQRTIQVEVGSGDGQVAEPREKDHYSFAGETWTVCETSILGNGFAELISTRPERAVHAGRGAAK